MRTRKLITGAFLLGLLLIFTSASKGDKETEKLRDANSVLQDFGNLKESIPHDLISQYQGIVIVPNLINAGIGIGGKRGKGIAIVKLDDGTWSNPVFVTLTGGSIGPQIGIQSVDLVLVFRHKGVLTEVKKGDFTIGGDISATAGPVGRSTSANTDYKLEAEVYSYSRSRGLFAGISINGSNLAIDNIANNNFYGDGANAQDIFANSKSTNKAVNDIKTTLAGL